MHLAQVRCEKLPLQNCGNIHSKYIVKPITSIPEPDKQKPDGQGQILRSRRNRFAEAELWKDLNPSPLENLQKAEEDIGVFSANENGFKQEKTPVSPEAYRTIQGD